MYSSKSYWIIHLSGWIVQYVNYISIKLLKRRNWTTLIAIYLFILVELEFELRASCLQSNYTGGVALSLEPHLQSTLLWLFGDGVSQTICLECPRNAILPISASQVTRIKGVSHWHTAYLYIFNFYDLALKCLPKAHVLNGQKQSFWEVTGLWGL
jgi:hypothetical protein